MYHSIPAANISSSSMTPQETASSSHHVTRHTTLRSTKPLEYTITYTKMLLLRFCYTAVLYSNSSSSSSVLLEYETRRIGAVFIFELSSFSLVPLPANNIRQSDESRDLTSHYKTAALRLRNTPQEHHPPRPDLSLTLPARHSTYMYQVRYS